MRIHVPNHLCVAILACMLSACGGGGGAGRGPSTASDAPGSSTSAPTTTATTTTSSTTTSSTTTTSLPIGATVTSLQIQGLGAVTQNGVPFTFGQPFAPGEIGPAESLTGKLDGAALGLQIDVKARHADGSIRHAIISGVLPQLASGQTRQLELSKTNSYSGTAPSNALSNLLASGFASTVKVTLGGQVYSASAENLLGSGSPTTWLAGPYVNEWLVDTPLKTAGGVEHPHLTAHFAIRHYEGTSKTRVDVIVENGWAYQPNPQDFTYDVEVSVDGQPVYTKTGLTHYHHARWRKTLWSGTAPAAHVAHNTAYLIATKAVPNYDQSIPISGTALTNWKNYFDAASTGPMGNGIATAYMPTTGGRPDIGLHPGWNAATVLSMDKRVKTVALGMGDLAGSWSTHYRDKVTNKPISLADYPYMTSYPASGDSVNPGAGNRQEAWTPCTTVCNSPNIPDTAHLPALAYVPYLLTGDHYYMEELEFYGMWAVSVGVGAYRNYGQGLVGISNQVRGMAWILRDVFNAAYILPDNEPMKAAFTNIAANNMAWFNANYTNNINANVFGVITHSYSFAYTNPWTGQGETGIAPWQDDFFTSVIGHATERGFPNTAPLLAYKSKFAVGRMTDPGYCWVLGSIYSLFLRDTSVSPLYTTYAQAYQASTSTALRATACGSADMASVLQSETGTPMVAGAMVGYPTSATGAPANAQPAFAYAKDSGIAGSSTAWNIFNSRALKGDYTMEPQFSIVPRN